MVSSSLAVSVLLCLFLACQASLLHDPATPSASSSSPLPDPPHPRHHHRRHHHHRHHQASGGLQQAAKGPEGVDVAPGGAKPRKDGRTEGAEKQGSPQEVSHRVAGEDGDSSRVKVSTPKTTPALPARSVSVEKVGRDDPEAGESVQQAGHPQPAEDGDPTARPPIGQARDAQPSPASPPHPEPAPSTTTSPPKKPRQAGVADAQRSQQTTAAVDTTTDRTGRPLSRHVDNEDDQEDENQPHNPPVVQETPDKPGDDKRSNRPRLRHTLLQNEQGDDSEDAELHHQRPAIKDNSSRHRLRQKKPVAPGVEDPRPDPESPRSGPSPHPDPVLRQRDRNRPGWGSPEDKAAGSPSARDPSPGGQKVNRATALPPEAEEEQEKGEKRKKAKVAKAKKVMKKMKMKKMKKSKALLKGCPGCTQAEIKQKEARELHKQVLKAQLLDKLRLVPTFQKQPWPPKLPDQVFPDLTQSDQGLHEDRYYARPTQLLLLGHDLGPRHRLKKAATGTYRFKVGGKVKGTVRSAQLWVYKMKDANDAHEQTLVITELQRTKRRRLRERSLVARLDTRVREGWVTFDVTSLVNRWIENETPASLQLLAIRCKTCHRTSYRAIFGVKSHFHPVLVIREAQEGRGRDREQRSECDPTNGCCKFDLTVTFEELGIHEIFRPLSIKADYCYGTCERPDAYHYNHTMIMQHMRFNSHVSNSTLRQRLQPCCVPVVLREATIYHYFNAGLDSQVSLVPNLLVDRCGCA